MAANERDERVEPFEKQMGSEQSKGGGYEGEDPEGEGQNEAGYASGKDINSSADGEQEEGGNGGEGIKTPL